MWSYQTPPELDEQQYSRWQSLLEKRTGIYFSTHKSILQTGLLQRMREIGIQDYEYYFEQVSTVPDGMLEWARLVDKISVKDTRFFRESAALDLMRDYLTNVLNKNNTSSGIRQLDIWSAGCSTGEEAYSLAITAKEVIEDLSIDCLMGVMATDISQAALSTAQAAFYSARKLDDVSADIKNTYFVKHTENRYKVVDTLRNRLCFAQGNLLELEKMPKHSMDVIYCQNVLLYFRRERQSQVLNGLVEHLKPGGLLIIGLGEATGWQHPQMRLNGDATVRTFIKDEYSKYSSTIQRQRTNPKKVAKI